MPLLVADYCHMRDSQDSELAKVLVAKLFPARAILAVVVDQKGLSEMVTDRVAKFIKDSGYLKLAYRSDQEPSIRAMLDYACVKAGRDGVEQATPEASAVGESQSNGKAESAVGQLEDLVRTYKAALEDRIGERVPSTHPVIHWIVEHAASVYNRFVVGEDGQTPYEAMHGQRFRGKLAEFGEQVFYFIPRKLRSKLDLRWRIGTFLGNSQSSNEAFVATTAGGVVKTRSVVRVVEPSRWNSGKVMGVRGLPSHMKINDEDTDDAFIEEMREPHRGGDDLPADQDGDQPRHRRSRQAPVDEHIEIGDAGMKTLDRQLKITQKDLNEFGYTDGCPKCMDIINKRSWKRQHNDDCRLRIYMEYQRSDHPKWKAVEHLFKPDQEEKFQQRHVDVERAASAPRALDGTNLFDDANADSKDPKRHEPNNSEKMDTSMADQEEMEENIELVETALQMDEDNVAHMFMDAEAEPDADAMVQCLTTAGISEDVAKETAGKMYAFKESKEATFTEVYGRSVFDQSQIQR